MTGVYACFVEGQLLDSVFVLYWRRETIVGFRKSFISNRCCGAGPSRHKNWLLPSGPLMMGACNFGLASTGDSPYLSCLVTYAVAHLCNTKKAANHPMPGSVSKLVKSSLLLTVQEGTPLS